MRLILQDRVPATTIVVLVTYLLLVQAVLAGLAQGAMATAVTDSVIVICSSHGAVTVKAPGSDGPPPAKAFHCPCATLCQLAATAVPVVFGGFIGIAAMPLGPPLAGLRMPPEALTEVLEHLAAEARAPPALSI